MELCALHPGYSDDTAKRKNLNSEGGCHGLEAKSPRKELGAPFPSHGIERQTERRKGGVPSRGSRGRQRIEGQTGKRGERVFRVSKEGGAK